MQQPQNERQMELSRKLDQTPPAFKNWVSERKASTSDLMPLNSLKDLSSVSALLEKFSEQRLTRSSGKQVLDLLVDLVMMGQPVSELLPGSSPWIEQLKKQRYPKAASSDSRPWIEQNNWPQFARVQKKRQGDRLNYQMILQFQNENDLKDKLQRLIKKLDNDQ